MFDNDVIDKKEDNVVLIEGQLLKKSPWLHYNDRYGKLYSTGYIDYFKSKEEEEILDDDYLLQCINI